MMLSWKILKLGIKWSFIRHYLMVHQWAASKHSFRSSKSRFLLLSHFVAMAPKQKRSFWEPILNWEVLPCISEVVNLHDTAVNELQKVKTSVIICGNSIKTRPAAAVQTCSPQALLPLQLRKNNCCIATPSFYCQSAHNLLIFFIFYHFPDSAAGFLCSHAGINQMFPLFASSNVSFAQSE